MILLTPCGSDSSSDGVFAVFGVGLIGTSVVQALTTRAAFRTSIVPVSWEETSDRRDQLRRLETRLEGRLLECEGKDRSSYRVGIVWSAGKAGFEATTSQADRELESFRDVLLLARRLACRLPSEMVTFALISSAGGLFEGQRFVDPASSPEARRPYGVLKLRQERLLAESADLLVSRIYRLTSVYGHLAPGRRRGLVSTLILNGMRRQVTPLTGRMDTLRDFIWADDVGRFVVRDLYGTARDRSPSPLLLASAKPSSIHEVLRIAEQVLGRKIYVSFESGEENSADITFSPRAVARGWQSSDLASNVRRVYLRALSSGAAFDRPAA